MKSRLEMIIDIRKDMEKKGRTRLSFWFSASLAFPCLDKISLKGSQRHLEKSMAQALRKQWTFGMKKFSSCIIDFVPSRRLFKVKQGVNDVVL